MSETKQASGTSVAAQPHPVARFLLAHRTEIGAAGAIVIVFAIFGALNPNFLTARNLSGILTVSAEIGLLSLGVGLVIIVAEIDISIAAVFTVAGIIMGQLLTWGWSDFAALTVVLLFGVIAGLINGVGTVVAKIPSLIVTLGTLALWTGFAIAFSGGTSIYLPQAYPVLNILAGYTVGPSTFHVSIFWWLGFGVLFYFLLHKTAFGNWIYATGGNATAARSVGVPAVEVKLACFVVCSVLAALGGLVSLGRNSLMSPVVTTNNLEAIAAAVIGGVSIWGGVGSVPGILMGTIALSSIDIGLVTAGAPAFWYQALVGVVIITIVMLNRYIDAAITKRVRA
jgi:simple sugar transport system permease protein